MSARPIVLSLGGNLGDVGAALARAVALIDELPRVRITAVSAVYRTPAWGKTDQPDFLNIVALGETTLSPHDLLAGTQGVEDRLGRVRDERWGPRVIDIDLIVVGDESRDDARLTLPHPLAHERGFVLVPWLNADHNWAILRRWDALEDLGFPLLLAVSRKRFLGALLASGETPRPPRDRDAATAYLSGHFAARGVWGVRVHDVRGSADAIATACRLGEQ